MTITIPYSEACERNKGPILDCIKPYLRNAQSVLEIGSGTGQHALHFAANLPHLKWQTSDQEDYLPGLVAQLTNAKLSNALLPIALNVNQSPWLATGQHFDAVYTANTFHIMREAEIEQFFDKLPTVTLSGSHLFVYGPFKYKGEFTSRSNQEFDQRLRERGVGSGIREFEWVDGMAVEAGFSLLEDQAMPANNQCLVWRAG